MFVGRRGEAMRVTRALLLSSLVPLAAVAVVGVGLGCRSITDLGAFVLMWAIFILPLVAPSPYVATSRAAASDVGTSGTSGSAASLLGRFSVAGGSTVEPLSSLW